MTKSQEERNILRVHTYRSRPVFLNHWWWCPLGDSWHCLETILIVLTRGGGQYCYLLVGRSQGCSCMSFSAQGSPPAKNYLAEKLCSNRRENIYTAIPTPPAFFAILYTGWFFHSWGFNSRVHSSSKFLSPLQISPCTQPCTACPLDVPILLSQRLSHAQSI